MKETLSKSSILYLDLDGVFANMEDAVIRLTKERYDPATSWGKIDKIPGFFRMLEPLTGALRFFDTIRSHSILPIEFLTSSPDPTGCLTTCEADKKWWVERYITRTHKVNVVRGWRNKALFANGNVLVDDSLRNINDWVKCGGRGVHHTGNRTTLMELGWMGVLN